MEHWLLNNVCPVMASFLEKAWLTSFYIYNSTCIINSKCRCACLVCRKVTMHEPDLPDCLLWPCSVRISTTKWLHVNFLRGVCLHCREMGMIYMCHWKQNAWVWISAMWIPVVMSVSRCRLLHNAWLLVLWFNILVTSMFPNWNIGWPTKGV